MPEQRRNERDLVLAPNEFAFISDETKGNINVYVGPYKTSLADTDQPVVFDPRTKRFEQRSLKDAVQIFNIAPEGWYTILKNPARDNHQPKIGTVNNLSELNIGRKINIPGPIDFPLWPGQMARVVRGHHLRSNQYIIARVYDVDAARQSWSEAVMTPQTEGGDGNEEETKALKPSTEPPPELTMGELLIIKGTDVSFYIPPTGIEVVAEGDLTSNKERTYRFVRDAVTLERLEYCILLDEDGNKRFVRGPAVVFPKPTEHFLQKKNTKGEKTRKFRAIELNPQMGIYVKVIADYDKHKAGDELFITGKDTKIYYPREEHAIIKYADEEIHYAITIPAGEARYVLNKVTGDVELIKGPAMFLPDPRTQVIVRRVLPPRLVELMYPGNQEALDLNIQLSELKEALNLDEHQHVTRGMVTGPPVVGAASAYAVSASAMPAGVTADDLSWMASDAEEEKVRVQRLMRQRAAKGFAGDDFDRKTEYTPPRTIQLDTKYEGAVRMNIWTGYAVQIVSATGSRRIVVGPATVLLSYDETPEVIELSRGVPKEDKNLKKTVYLRCRNNKVSDMITAETKDRVNVNIVVSYRVNFEGEPEKWFEVENYVKFMTDHCRSMIRNNVKQIGIEAFDADSIAIVRDTILGIPGEDGKRTGRQFEENGMRIYDVEVLEVAIGDPTIQSLLRKTQHKSVQQALEIAEKERSLDIVKRSESLDREGMAVQHETTLIRASLKLETIAKELELNMSQLRSKIDFETSQRKAELAAQDDIESIHTAELIREKNAELQQMEFDRQRLQMAIDDLSARKDAWVAKAQAISPKLVEALQGFIDKDIAARVGEALGPLSLLGGDSAADILNKVLTGSRLEGVFRGNGGDGPARLSDGSEAPDGMPTPRKTKGKTPRQRT